MNKTLLDEFAMAAMVGWLSSRQDPSVLIDTQHAAASFYVMADAMMAERAKRMPQTETEPKQSTTSVYETDEAQKLLAAMASFAGRKVTCNDIHKKAFGHDGDMTSLREIGANLRQMGFAKVRSGGKDYYQL